MTEIVGEADSLGCAVGLAEGDALGLLLGAFVGCEVGFAEGDTLGE